MADNFLVGLVALCPKFSAILCRCFLDPLQEENMHIKIVFLVILITTIWIISLATNFKLNKKVKSTLFGLTSKYGLHYQTVVLDSNHGTADFTDLSKSDKIHFQMFCPLFPGQNCNFIGSYLFPGNLSSADINIYLRKHIIDPTAVNPSISKNQILVG